MEDSKHGREIEFVHRADLSEAARNESFVREFLPLNRCI